MYFVGIDVSKFKHDCAIIDELGNVITPSWSFQNDCEGFSLLRELLDALDGEKKIGLEATGHYGQNLKLFLENNCFSFMEFNPLLINRFVRSKSLRKTKSDSIDALMIAQYLMTVEYKPYPPSPPSYWISLVSVFESSNNCRNDSTQQQTNSQTINNINSKSVPSCNDLP